MNNTQKGDFDMITKKHFIVIAFFITVIILCNTCENNTYNNRCYCETKDHLEVGETCNCGASKGACNCVLWVAYLENIPIHKKGVEWIGDLDSAVTNIFRAYTLLEAEEKTVVKNKVKEIIITPGNNWGESIISLVMTSEGTILEINGSSSRDYDIYIAFKYWVLS